MATIWTSISRRRQDFKRRQDKGGQGIEVSGLPATATTDQTSASTALLVAPAGSVNILHTSMTIAEIPPELPVLLDSQPPNPHSPPSSSIRPSAESTVSGTPSTNDDADLWEQAYEMFRKQEPDLIKDYSKHLLGNVAAGADLSSRQSVETVLKKLLEQREKKQWQIPFLSSNVKIRTQIEGLAKFLKWSDPFIKDAVSTQPYAALAWSGVSLLLPLLTSSTTQNEAMLEGFNSIGELQIFWKAWEDIYLQHKHRQHYQPLMETLVKLYSRILTYQAHVICHLSKAQHSRVWRNLSSSSFWTDKLTEIDKLDGQCRKLLDPSLEKEIQENRDSQLEEMQKSRITQEDILQTLKEDRKDEKETRLLQDLAAAAEDYERYKDLNPDKVRGTCEWFLTDERFGKWRDSKSLGLLWVSAGPGRGKSVLSKSLIKEGQLATRVTTITITPSSLEATTSKESTVCYFFFKDGGDGRMDSAHALCAMLHQLFTCPSTSGLIKHALKSHRELGAILTAKFSELWRILLDCVTSPDVGEIICVLDALDECKEGSRQEFIGAVKEFYSRSENVSIPSSQLKFLVTSRPYPDLEQSFQNFPTTAAYLRFDADDKSEDIRQEIDLVIDARVQDITADFTTEDQQKISMRLKNMEHRTYLWLHLTFDIIEKSPTKYGRRPDIEKLLSHLPSEVSDAYEKILSRSTDQLWTKILLRIMLATARPLTLDEANAALTLAIEEEELTSHAELESAMWPRDRFRSIVTNLCGLFVSVYDTKLSFIHQTAREFLTNPKTKGNWQGHFKMPESHNTISQSCLLYLLLPDIKIPSEDDLAKDKEYPYLAYSAAYWPLHFVSQEATNANAFRRHARMLCKTTEHQASIWAPSYLKQRNLHSVIWTDLALASHLGLVEVVQDILFKEKPDVDTEAQDKDGWTTLLWAVEGGHEAVVKLLLKKGADTEAKDKDGWTTLSWAAERGHEAVVKLLSSSG